MKILVLNCGSSSVKYKLIDTASEQVLAEGGVEKIGLPDGFLKYKSKDGSKKILDLGMTDHKGSIKAILELLRDPDEGCIASFEEIDAVGHRVVHGGEKFNKSVLITEEVKEMIRECYDIAPLHNPANMTGIEAIEALMPGLPQVAVFDTAFHQTMPPASYMYALPMKYYKEDGVRRYGFHGTSHRYVSQRVGEILGVDIADKKVHHLPRRQRRLDHGRARRQERRHLDGPHSHRRPHDGNPRGRRRPRRTHLHHDTPRTVGSRPPTHHQQGERHARRDRHLK